MSRLRGKKLFMSIKIDIEKAYDSLSWDFIHDILIAAGIPSNLRRLIFQCITTASMQVLWNGELTESFNMGRGIRQGCPLSPYIFVLCIERMSHLISSAVGEGVWRPIRAGRHGPPLSHPMFADDLLLFSKASLEQVQVIKNVLDALCAALGQKVNTAKSLLFFSRNVSSDLRAQIMQASGFVAAPSLRRYLGVPLIVGRVTRDHFQSVITRVRSRLEGWESRCLSLASRITLARSVIQIIPYYSMQVLKFPASICDELECICRNFIWRHRADQRKLHLKYVGRVDEALKLHTSPPNSWLWKAITRAWNQVSKGATWTVSHGDRARFWEDRPQAAHMSVLRAAESFSGGWQDQLNTDGASKGNPGPAGAGGVLRKEDGVWIAGFARHVGIATAIVAELWGVLSGLELAWELDYWHVLLDVDSLLVTRLIAGSRPGALQLRTIVREIRLWLERDWHVEVSHQYREGNSVADWMARWSLSLPLGLHIQHTPPPKVRALLSGDIVGAALPRLCSI
ncbi:hypothetical protein CRG98_022955 [Punica granatum]|uniref:Reverse transcriptase domain-containing protein n=1 Tax=Punica granatum TaxID=22663 RepID=A0A2I0JL30_PUNGR|nr:hypothetical protein CRG98_022955 [Punica granatum]